MQVNNKQNTEGFQPVIMELVLETAEEVRAFGTICNYTPFVDAGHAVGIDLTKFSDALPEGAYDPETWNEDVAPVEEVLNNHPALDYAAAKIEAISVDTAEDIVNAIVEDFLAPVVDEEPSNELTVSITNIVGYTGTINVSDGRKYTYRIANCGVALQIKSTTGLLLTEIPMTIKGSRNLQPEDLEVIATVLSKIS